jgi:hypothetical protein
MKIFIKEYAVEASMGKFLANENTNSKQQYVCSKCTFLCKLEIEELFVQKNVHPAYPATLQPSE